MLDTDDGPSSGRGPATAALRAGVSPEVGSERLGHADVTVTLAIHAHAFDNDARAAANRVADAIHGA